MICSHYTSHSSALIEHIPSKEDYYVSFGGNDDYATKKIERDQQRFFAERTLAPQQQKMEDSSSPLIPSKKIEYNSW